MSDTENTRDDEARKAAQDRRTAAGKDPKAFGPGGNPDGVDDDGDDEGEDPVDPAVPA